MRNLAPRAASAARDTSQMVTGIVEKINTGDQLARDTGKTITMVPDNVAEVCKPLGEISTDSNGQASSIEQINASVANINEVTQKNAKIAQDLVQIMDKFRLNAGEAGDEREPIRRRHKARP